MNRYLKLTRLATLVAGCALVSACNGGDDSSTPSIKNSYPYRNLSICKDADLNGQCGELEEKFTHLSGQFSSGPFLIDSEGYFLTAHSTSMLVSPFTTLIQNEMLFNPSVAGSVGQARNYLQQVFGKTYNLEFSTLDTMHGPSKETQLLLASFQYALTLDGDAPYLKIAAAVDKMVTTKSFDITQTLTQADLTNSFVNLNNQYLLSGSYAISGLVSPKSISINENTGQLLILSSLDKLL